MSSTAESVLSYLAPVSLVERQEWVWIIGGGVMQLPVIKEAKRRGYSVLVTDGNEFAPGTTYADMFVQLSTYDVSGHVKLGHELGMTGMPLCAVLTDAADVGPTVSAVCQGFKFPAATWAAADRTRNKAFMRRSFSFAPYQFFFHPIYQEVNGKYVDRTIVEGGWERATRYYNVIYPIIVKPVDNSASRGITKVYSSDYLVEAIRHAHSFNHNSDIVLLEECLSGDEVAIDFFIVDGKAIYANGAKRIFGKFGIELGHVNPFIPDQYIIDMATQAAKALGVDRGPFKMDLINDSRYGWCILECATRLSGGYDHTNTCVLATGKDIVGAVLDFSLGLPLDMNKLTPKWNKYACALVDDSIDYKSCADRTVFAIAEGNTEEEAIANARRLL